MNISVIHPSSDKEYETYYKLRWEVLRKPLGQPKVITPVEGDDIATHFMAIDEDNNCLAICRLQFNTSTESQVRFVAVSDQVQGKGLGKLIMNAAEKYAVENGATKMILHARENAVDFYKRLGYNLIDKSYLLFDQVQHYLMNKCF